MGPAIISRPHTRFSDSKEDSFRTRADTVLISHHHTPLLTKGRNQLCPFSENEKREGHRECRKADGALVVREPSIRATYFLLRVPKSLENSFSQVRDSWWSIQLKVPSYLEPICDSRKTLLINHYPLFFRSPCAGSDFFWTHHSRIPPIKEKKTNVCWVWCQSDC